MKTSTRILTVLILTMGLSAGALADDTDIYLDPLVPSGSRPLVMFTLDFKENLGRRFSQRKSPSFRLQQVRRAARHIEKGSVPAERPEGRLYDAAQPE
jgi:hypothetical protein